MARPQEPWYITAGGDSYQEAREQFTWDIPDGYNIAQDFLRKHPDAAGSVALYQEYQDGRQETYSFRDLDVLSNRLAHGLRSLGVERGDRVAIMVPQKPATMLTHLACWKLGAVSIPLSVLFGEDALAYRLQDSGASVAVVDADVRETVENVREDCPALEAVVEAYGDATGDAYAFADVHAGEARSFDIADTDAETPAILMYTSGSTGPPKGVLHGHQVWLACCAAYNMYFGNGAIEDEFMEHGVVWMHADWAWLGSLGVTTIPAWHYGRPIVGYPMGPFDPEKALDVLESYDVSHPGFVPTALRMMMNSDHDPADYDLGLDVVMSGSEPVTPEIVDWVEDTFGADMPVNETYGATETGGIVVCGCEAWYETRPGSMGKPAVGHDVAILDTDTGEPVPQGEVGEIAVDADGDPGILSEYWNLPEKTDEAFLDGWFLTGDLAEADEDGYYWYVSRADDVIITSGYRVGPTEVEEAILEHAAVEQVGVIGVPDDTRGEVIKAFVKPVEGAEADAALREEIQDLVREDLAQYKYPREIEFIEDVPQTVTGKLQRSELRERDGIE